MFKKIFPRCHDLSRRRCHAFREEFVQTMHQFAVLTDFVSLNGMTWHAILRIIAGTKFVPDCQCEACFTLAFSTSVGLPYTSRSSRFSLTNRVDECVWRQSVEVVDWLFSRPTSIFRSRWFSVRTVTHILKRFSPLYRHIILHCVLKNMRPRF